jgi:hypothetical protein
MKTKEDQQQLKGAIPTAQTVRGSNPTPRTRFAQDLRAQHQ